MTHPQPNKRLHTERVITLSVMMQSVSPSGEPQAVRLHTQAILFSCSFSPTKIWSFRMQLCESTAEERNQLDTKLVAFNKSRVPFEQSEDWIGLSHVIKDDTGIAIGGINATLYCWNIMYVDILYVDEAHRRKGYGKLLLEKAENKARSLGGYLSHLDTFDWQAKEFYERQGYSVFGLLENCPRGHSRHYLKKQL
jgi:GNAT superfamily N-acetyltransferase